MPHSTLVRLLSAGVVLLLALKLVLALQLDLYSDEIYYWLASTRPALAYSDLPFMTQLSGPVPAPNGSGVWWPVFYWTSRPHGYSGAL